MAYALNFVRIHKISGFIFPFILHSKMGSQFVDAANKSICWAESGKVPHFLFILVHLVRGVTRC